MKKTIKKATIRKAQRGITAAKADATRVARPQVKDIQKDKKDAADLKKLKGKYTAIAVPDRESTFKGDSIRYYPGQKGFQGTPYIRDLGKARGVTRASDKDLLKASRSKSARTYQDTTAVKANPEFMSNQKNGGVTKAKSGKQMLKRADGSVSQRGLWDNIRAAKGSGKKPTAAMLKQEKKIKAQSKKK